MQEIIFDKDFAVIKLDKELSLMELEWKRIISSSEYREGFRCVLENIENNSIARIITDSRKQGIIAPEDRIWLETEMIPKAIKGGLRYIATVMSENVFKKYYLNQIVKQSTKSGIEMELFDNYNNAKNWILSKI